MARLAIAPEERKKLYVLGGLLAAITLVVVVLYIPHGGTKTPVVAPVSPSNAPPVKNPSGAPGAIPAPGGAPPGGASTPAGSDGGSGGISAASLVPVSAYRDDPFKQVSLPPPLPTPPPPPPPPAPVILAPPSVALAPPGSGSYLGLPPFGIPTGGASTTPASRILRELPPPRISRVADAPTAPSLAVLPGGGEGGVSRSPGKRLAGVIIGDSVRALLEIDSGDPQTPPITRIVQPGDEVEGIRILRIERVSEGGRLVTRMFVRENNEERYIDLRAAPQQTAGAGGAPTPGRGPLP